jgi:hypothetical protein
MFMIKYAYSSFANTYFLFYRGKTTKTFFINVADSSSEHIRERLASFIVSQIISSKGEFYFKL